MEDSQVKTWFQNRRTKWRQAFKDNHNIKMYKFYISGAKRRKEGNVAVGKNGISSPAFSSTYLQSEQKHERIKIEF
jgi:hypothetical protein